MSRTPRISPGRARGQSVPEQCCQRRPRVWQRRKPVVEIFRTPVSTRRCPRGPLRVARTPPNAPNGSYAWVSVCGPANRCDELAPSVILPLGNAPCSRRRSDECGGRIFRYRIAGTTEHVGRGAAGGGAGGKPEAAPKSLQMTHLACAWQGAGQQTSVVVNTAAGE